jgi:transcription initiation factor TFIIIB Brf1 subunit/transcription initiation factor TFIIB
MARCPECGGEMTSMMKRKICETCGLAISPEEYDRMWDAIRDKKFAEERTKKREQAEYLEWLQSKKQNE